METLEHKIDQLTYLNEITETEWKNVKKYSFRYTEQQYRKISGNNRKPRINQEMLE